MFELLRALQQNRLLEGFTVGAWPATPRSLEPWVDLGGPQVRAVLVGSLWVY